MNAQSAETSTATAPVEPVPKEVADFLGSFPKKKPRPAKVPGLPTDRDDADLQAAIHLGRQLNVKACGIQSRCDDIASGRAKRQAFDLDAKELLLDELPGESEADTLRREFSLLRERHDQLKAAMEQQDRVIATARSAASQAASPAYRSRRAAIARRLASAIDEAQAAIREDAELLPYIKASGLNIGELLPGGWRPLGRAVAALASFLSNARDDAVRFADAIDVPDYRK